MPRASSLTRLPLPRPQLTDKHLKLARAIANCYRVGGTRCDFRSLAYYGLAIALEGFRDDKGASFETYARIRIHGTIKDYLRKIDTAGTQRARSIKRGESFDGSYLLPLEEASEVASSGPDPERQAQLALLVAVLMPAIAKLPPKLRQVIHAVDLEERTHAEAAAMLGISLSTAWDHRRQALDRLREKFA
jgi:RNA polymerase sigma factor (sigma-70 family)